MALYGIDVSGFQPGIDLSVVPCDFVGIYISGGTTTGNADGRRQVQQAVANGKRIILYHFENDGPAPGTPQQEAAWFLTMVEHVGPVPPNTLYALDNETGNALNVPWQRQFLDTVRVGTGSRGVGMYAPFGNIETGVYQPLRDAGYFLWESAYVLGSAPFYGYSVPGGRVPIPGGDPHIWQFTSTGYLNGWPGKLDLNVFLAGGTAEWDALAGSVGLASTSVTPFTEDPMFLARIGTDPKVYISNGIWYRYIGSPDSITALVNAGVIPNANVASVASLDALGVPADYITAPQFKADFWDGASDVERAARAAWDREFLGFPIQRQGVDTSKYGSPNTSVGAVVAYFDAAETGIIATVNAAKLDPAAVAQGIASHLTGSQVDGKAVVLELVRILNAGSASA